jgi:hypothetical protein
MIFAGQACEELSWLDFRDWIFNLRLRSPTPLPKHLPKTVLPLLRALLG